MIRLAFIFALTLSLAAACADTKATTAQTSSPSSKTQVAAERDLTNILSNAKPIWVNPYVDGGRPALQWSLAVNSGNGFDFLSHGQKLQLGGWKTPNGHEVDLMKWYLYVQSFDQHQGRLPKNGQEVVEYFASFTQGASLQDIAKMPDDDLPMWYYAMVNPQTGGLYQSFDGSIPEPGGIKLHAVTDQQDLARAYNGRPGADLWGRPGMAGFYEVIVSGEDPTVVLDTAVISLRKDDGTAAERIKEYWRTHPNG